DRARRSQNRRSERSRRVLHPMLPGRLPPGGRYRSAAEARLRTLADGVGTVSRNIREVVGVGGRPAVASTLFPEVAMIKMDALAVLAVLIGAPLPGFGKPSTGTEAEILKLEEKLLQAALKGDASTFQKLLADDYFAISGVTGSVATKQESLKNYQTSKL